MKNNTITMVRLPEEIKKQFEELCDKELLCVSAKIRILIQKELESQKNK